jgi:Asp-tRNA(Asn)/Glu-tRNA(Gln) amidotransferase A subunit family amidase
MFEEALARARECDAFLEREGKGMGALHGLPVSLKVSINLFSIPGMGFQSLELYYLLPSSLTKWRNLR